MRKSHLMGLGLFLILMLPSRLLAQDEMFKALFMYNFSKEIGWPESYNKGDFVIGILGSNPITSELEKIAQKKKVGQQNIRIVEFSKVDNITKCHFLYIPDNKSNEFDAVRQKLEGQPTVILTDKQGYAKKGAGINYVKIDGKQKFEINTKTLAGSGLNYTTFLTSLGIVVE